MQGPNAGQAVPGMQDPINALQNLASQGTRNTQLMGHGIHPTGNMPPIPASNLLQTLNQRPGPGLQGLQSLQGNFYFQHVFRVDIIFKILLGQLGGQLGAQMQGPQGINQRGGPQGLNQLAGQLQNQMQNPMGNQMQTPVRFYF